uniref:Uncharacterized protein n=1 Tax=Knipowitschia caucasica TaxID=637954 RepID=A0AAV2KPZ5_KNICA
MEFTVKGPDFPAPGTVHRDQPVDRAAPRGKNDPVPALSPPLHVHTVFKQKDPCSSPSRKEQKRAQYRQVKAHMQKEDGRVTAHGWSLPGKCKINGTQTESKMNLPVPVYLRPLEHKDNSMKLWCAAGVNMSGGRPELHRLKKGSQCSLDQLDHETKDPEKGEGERDVVAQDETSSRVWVCTSTHSSTKVTVLDATQPADILDTFYACNTHILCIASVPGVLETDFPAAEEVPQDVDGSQAGDRVSLAGSVASVGSTGSDGALAAEGTTAVPQTAGSRASEPPTEHSGISAPVELSRETSPSEDAAEEATEATEANAGVGEEGEEEGAEGETGEEQSQPGIYTEHVFTDPLGMEPDQTPKGPAQSSSCSSAEVTSLPEPTETPEGEVLRMSSALPTMWLGAQNGCLYVHSSVMRWKKCLHAIRLKDSILGIVHVKGRVLVALADGTLAIFHRNIADGQWDLTNYHLLDLGRPHHSIRCISVVHELVWCGYRNKIYVIQPRAMRIEVLTQPRAMRIEVLTQSKAMRIEVLTQSKAMRIEVLTQSKAMRIEVLTQSKAMRIEVLTQSKAMRIEVLTQSKAMRIEVLTQSKAMRIEVLTQSKAMRIEVLTQSKAMRIEVLTQPRAMRIEVLTQSKAMRIEVLTQSKAMRIEVLTQSKAMG